MAKGHFERLGTLDSAFLGLETPRAAMHIALAGVFEGAPLRDADGRVDLAGLKRATTCALTRIPRYGQKLAFTPVERRAVWIDDDRFDIDHHVLHAAVPQPGTEAGFKRVAATIVERPLDRSKPLWEIWVVEGLPDDRIALVCKVHHCMIDGVSGVELMGQLLSPDPNAREETPDRPFHARRAPTPAALAFEDSLRRWGMHWNAWKGATNRVFGPRSGAPRLLAAEATRRASALPTPQESLLRPASATSFNRPIGPRRRLSWVTTELADVERIRFAFGCSLNDVVLATVTGAVRAYLDLQGESLRGLDFRAMVPVDTSGDRRSGELGNRLSAWILRLPVDKGDPVEHVARIRAETARLKQSSALATTELLTQVGSWLPPQLIGLGARSATRLRPFNLVVTNVPGPPIPLYMRGARLLEGFPVVPLTDHLGLGIALLSYDGRLSWGLNGDYDLVPDLELFAELIAHAFDSLKNAAARAPSRDREVTTGRRAQARG